ncbi:hypothetical protein GA0004736_3413 [Curtobacterium sp. 9128]|uniref:hypothetical protein n=1 Tax=Curtobacterium sp. 9128 TaxID=1793722 RepID=UPI0007D7273B|nr:hypothetical protein [Curtobacterium sp. 9128]SBN64453.1 hypothetical protein GA0004736_3413 [Curtobacterium sp. 9128]
MTSYIVPDTLASPEDYGAIDGAPPAPSDIAFTLEACSDIVLRATITAVYDTDPQTGLATDPLIRQALIDATCIQAAAWVTLGIKPFAGGVIQGGVATSKGIGSGSISYAGVATAAAARADAAVSLVPAALRRLQNRGLIGQHVRVV